MHLELQISNFYLFMNFFGPIIFSEPFQHKSRCFGFAGDFTLYSYCYWFCTILNESPESNHFSINAGTFLSTSIEASRIAVENAAISALP